MPKLVYIGGYGHSGSTLLEYLLTASPEVLACGEVLSAARQQMRKEKCSCGELTNDCPVWGAFAASASKQEKLDHQALVLALLEQAAGKYAVVTDSSKTAWGAASVPFSLRRKLGSDFALVQIVRDPRAVAWSALKKAVRQGKRRNEAWRCIVAACGWTVANLACQLFGWFYPNQYARIRYEDMARSPEKQAVSLFRSVMSSVSCRLAELGRTGNRHQLFGNRVRSRMPALCEIKEDRTWETAMPRRYRWLIGGLTWPLGSRFGYYRRPSLGKG